MPVEIIRGHKPMVSVLMPVRNMRSTVARAIASVTNQTYRNIEVICVDDGSTDETGTIIKELGATDARICCQRVERSRGVGSARNIALTLVRGEYVCFVDGDDEVEPTYVETMVDRVEADGTQMACCGWDRGPGTKAHAFLADEVWSRKTVLEELQSNRPFFTSLWNKMFRADLVKHDGIPVPFTESLQIGEDEEWLSRVLRDCDSCSVVSAVLYHWHKNEGSLTFDEARATDERFAERIALWERKYHNLLLYAGVGERAQAKLAAELAQFVALRYVELGPAALSRYCSELHRARMAAEVRGGSLESEI